LASSGEFYCKELVSRVADIWKYLLIESSPAGRKKLSEQNAGSLPILSSIQNILNYDYLAVARVVELDVLVKLLDDEFAEQWDIGLITLLSILSHLAFSYGVVSTVERVSSFHKVTLLITRQSLTVDSILLKIYNTRWMNLFF
jgi:hypothetical protein